MKKKWPDRYSEAFKPLHEAYLELAALSDIEAGDTVKVLRKFDGYEMGFKLEWGTCEENVEVGKTYAVQSVHDGIITISNDNNNGLPFFVLELVSKGKKPIKVELNSSYTAEVTTDGVKVGCQTFSLAKMDELAAAVAEIRKA